MSKTGKLTANHQQMLGRTIEALVEVLLVDAQGGVGRPFVKEHHEILIRIEPQQRGSSRRNLELSCGELRDKMNIPAPPPDLDEAVAWGVVAYQLTYKLWGITGRQAVSELDRNGWTIKL